MLFSLLSIYSPWTPNLYILFKRHSYNKTQSLRTRGKESQRQNSHYTRTHLPRCQTPSSHYPLSFVARCILWSGWFQSWLILGQTSHCPSNIHQSIWPIITKPKRTECLECTTFDIASYIIRICFCRATDSSSCLIKNLKPAKLIRSDRKLCSTRPSPLLEPFGRFGIIAQRPGPEFHQGWSMEKVVGDRVHIEDGFRLDKCSVEVRRGMR